MQSLVKYYTVTILNSKNNNVFHQFINNSKAVLLDVRKGYPCWFVYFTNNEWHRVITSQVENVDHIQSEDSEYIILETRNTTYRFELQND